jgi:hypothetical protein
MGQPVRSQMAGAVIDPHRDGAASTREHVEIAVPIDVCGDDDPELDVVSVEHEPAEDVGLNGGGDTDFSARRERRGSRGRGHRQPDRHREYGGARP